MKNAGYTHTRGGVTLQLAKSYGFCWGVERAVQMAYEARKQYPTVNMCFSKVMSQTRAVNGGGRWPAGPRARGWGGLGGGARLV
jgi:4-hydroxy-3-methylbut-2-enyl diphosphate reductase